MEFKLTTGENREKKTQSTRVYFYYVSPTGYESPMTNAPARRLNQRKLDNGVNRTVEVNYSAETPFTIKMFTSRSAFGKPTTRAEVFLLVDPNAEQISISGLDGFGGFTGRAKLLKTDKEALKTLSINFEMLDAPLADNSGKKVRKLLYKKK